MKLTDFVGVDAKLEQLMRSAQAGRIVHALLFSGPRGTGKKSMAEVIARAALCTGEGARPCDACPGCKQCLNHSHPDVHYLAPEKNTLKVEQIRELTEALGLASYEGGKKIAIIERADSMNESAQNALLKTLESPTGDTLFFLLTDAPGALLKTIVSRCLLVRFSPLPVEACASVLAGRGVEIDRACACAALAQGSVGRALEIEADAQYFPLREKVLTALESLCAPTDVLRAAATMGDIKGRERDILEIMELWARDLMRVQNGVAPLETADAARLERSVHRGSALLGGVIETRKRLAANVSWTNAIEPMEFGLIASKRPE